MHGPVTVRMWRPAWWLVWAAGLALLLAPQARANCPTRCLCFRTTVRCMFLQLEKIPKVPPETTILDLRFNRIREIPPDSFRGLTHLDTLLLNNNHIRKIENDAFEGLSELQYLYLYKNHIRTIESKAFHGLNKLEQLYIHFNNIEDIATDTFSKLPALKRLFLHNNKLKRLPKGVFKRLTSLRRLRLDSNALICDCRMMWLQEMLKSNHGFTQAAATCEFPSKVQGKSLLSVDMEDFHCRKPSITEGPSDVEVAFGSTAYLSCRAEGDPEPEIIWLHNNHQISPRVDDHSGRFTVRDDGTLMIENTQDSDQGVYECVARNVAGETKATAIELRSQNLNVIGAGPAARSRPEAASRLDSGTGNALGGTGNDLRVVSPQRPPVSGLDRLDRRDLEDQREPIDRRDPFVDVPAHVERRDPFVDVPDHVGRRDRIETREARTVPPAVPVVTRDTTILQGQQLILDCQQTHLSASQVLWTKDNLPLVETIRYSVLPSGSLLIANIQYEDRGLYRCVSQTDLRAVTAQVRVTVQVQPTFSERPHDQYVVQGHLVTFSCRAEGYPTPTLRWNIGGHALPRDGRFTMAPNGRTLTVSDVRPEDEGLYVCVAVSSAGERSASAELLIKPREQPQFTRTPTDAERSVGGNVEFFCSASSASTVRWLHNNDRVIQTHRTFISEEGDLAIYNLTTTDDGLYECQAENSAGLVRTYARLSILVNGVPYVGDPFVQQSVHEAIVSVNRAINNTLAEVHDPRRRRTPSELLTLFRLPSHQALQVTRAAEIYERSLEIISEHVRAGHRFNVTGSVNYHQLVSPSNLAAIARLSGCEAHRRNADCRDMCYHHKYRTFDGTCNNLQHPMWGASLIPLRRMMRPVYENDFNTPVGWNISRLYNGYRLPSARRVSLRLASANRITPDERYTHMLMQWGQFMDHDLDFVPMAASNARFSDGRHCNETCANQAPCFPIPVEADDPRIQRHRCIGVTRSSAVCGSGMTSLFFQAMAPRQQINQLTSYMDASNVYGSSEHEATLLRDLATERGLLRTGIATWAGRPLLPANVDSPVDCQMDPNTAHIPCFLAGDHRANEQLGLLSMHTMWLREHNRIAEQLLALNPHWDGDMLFHEARKIVGAEMQHISFTHWLPKVLGPTGMEMVGEYKGYDPTTDSTIINSFAAAAFRFGHALVNPIIYRFNETLQPIPEGNLPLHKAFFAPFRIVEEGGIDPIIRGLFGVAAKKLKPGEFLNTELTERLFQLAHEVGLDLAALNIQRGRDHGLPSYNDYRRTCGLTYASTFDDFREEITDIETRRRLRDIYSHPSNVDLWAGGLSEEMVPGARMGPTFMCIIAQQFKRLRNGDRFWYENPGVFSPSQLTQIRQATLSRIICDNSDNIRQVPPDVFSMTPYPQGYLSCDGSQLPRVDLKVWTHCCHDCATSGEFNSITSHVFRRRRSAGGFSFPEDRNSQRDEPSADVQVTEQVDGVDGRDRGGSPVDEQGVSESHAHGPDTHTKAMDAIDTRIEGVESIMFELKRTVHKLSRKLRRLEHRMATQTLLRDNKTCLDTAGAARQDKERWREHDCRICECKAGQVECQVETCQLPKCMYPKKVPGQCCPICS